MARRWFIRRSIVLAALAVVGLSAMLLYRFRGAAPAILPPADTAEPAASLPVEETDETPTPAPAVNTTGIPLTLPDGFSISVFARGLTAPRVLVEDPTGTLIVSDPKAGTVLALPDDDHDGTADAPRTLASRLNAPHGLALRCTDSCTLYVAETNALLRYAYDPAARTVSDKTTLMALPAGGEHTTRSLQLIGTPGGTKILIATGSTCNACRESDDRRAAITIADLDGSNARLFASGLRNTVFMTADPLTGSIWGADMGRDNLGDNLPPDEINILEDGRNYGWPFCYGQSIRDTKVSGSESCATRQPPLIELQAHSAPLGIGFVPAAGWPDGWAHDLIVAYHGSWNRSEPTGYKLVRLELDADNRLVAEHPFISGWLGNGTQAYGRPAGILLRPNGTMFVADDKAGLVYLVQYAQS